MKPPIERVERKLVHKGAITEFYTDTIIDKEGRTSYYDFINHNGAAGVLPVTEDGKILLVRQYRNALDRFTLEIPAGGKNKGESTRDCAARELLEETGYESSHLSLLVSVNTTVAFCNELIDVYLADHLVKREQHLDPGEYVDVESFTLGELTDLVMSGEIKDSKTISAIMTYAVKLGHTNI